jgi:O-acetyl-ADP-ribose deacetylase (regulator of RNase III)
VLEIYSPAGYLSKYILEIKMDRSLLKHIRIRQGDITGEATDAIVNAANPSLLGGGGVDGAIHRAAGTELLAECRTLGGCRHGEARITRGYNLRAKYVIHTPGPIYHDGKSGEKNTLRHSYMNSLALAKDYNLRSISFPGISTGVYGYPKDEACEVAVDSALEFMETTGYVLEVSFVLFDRDNYKRYEKYIKKLSEG